MLLRLQGVMVDNTRKMNAMSTASRQAASQRRSAHHSEGTIFEEDDQGRTVVEWRVIATFLDRVFFILYIIAMIVSFCIVFPR